MAGHGVALAPYALAHEDLQQGRLILCDSAPLPNDHGYRIVIAPGLAAVAKVQTFVAWLHDEVATMLAPPPSPSIPSPKGRR